MRCKDCGKCIKEWRKRKCWVKWQLCGMCGVNAHPEAYCNKTIACVNGKGYYRKKR